MICPPYSHLENLETLKTETRVLPALVIYDSVNEGSLLGCLPLPSLRLLILLRGLGRAQLLGLAGLGQHVLVHEAQDLVLGGTVIILETRITDAFLS